jgi:1-acyl-sn-glycerol-3-phosphate acyltransferase
MKSKGSITPRIIIQTIHTWITFPLFLVVLCVCTIPFFLMWIIKRDVALTVIIPMVRFTIKLWFFCYPFSNFDIQLNGLTSEKKPRIYILNHSSMFDNLMMYFLPGNLKLLVKESYTKVPFLGWVISMAGGVVVRQAADDSDEVSESYTESVAEIEKGDPLIVFPEGTKTKTSLMGRFKTGGFKMALESKAEIVPVIFDTWDSLRPGEIWIRDSNAAMHVLDPVPYESYKDLDCRDFAKMMRVKMAVALQELRDCRTAREKNYYRRFPWFVEQDKKQREKLSELQSRLTISIR